MRRDQKLSDHFSRSHHNHFFAHVHSVSEWRVTERVASTTSPAVAGANSLLLGWKSISRSSVTSQCKYFFPRILRITVQRCCCQASEGATDTWSRMQTLPCCAADTVIQPRFVNPRRAMDSLPTCYLWLRRFSCSRLGFVSELCRAYFFGFLSIWGFSGNVC